MDGGREVATFRGDPSMLFEDWLGSRNVARRMWRAGVAAEKIAAQTGLRLTSEKPAKRKPQ
jgi:hypothetical protein